MTGILIVTHGDFAKGIVNGMELICGPQENLETLSLVIQDDMEVFAQRVREKAEALDTGDGVLILVDFMSGSPANAVGRFILSQDNAEAIAGVNFPMLLEAVNDRDSMDVHELAETCRAMGAMGIMDLKKRLQELQEDEE